MIDEKSFYDNTQPTLRPIIKQGENNMADPVTMSDIAAQTKEISDFRRETAGNIKDSRHDVLAGVNANTADLSKQVDAIDDTLTAQAANYFIANQQYAFQNARDVAALKAATDMGLMRLAGDIQTQAALGQAASALESAKVAAAVALGQSQLERAIVSDGSETRRLINELKYNDLNRALIERNSELVEERQGRRHWHDRADFNHSQGQWAALQSQLQAFGSQLQETRQGINNFGTMSGGAGQQTSTSNNA